MGTEWRLDYIMGLRDLLRGGVTSSFRKRLKDDFAGSAETGIGISTDGSSWKTIRGQFDINGSGQAQATGTDYPIAAVDMGVKNVDISVVGSSGGPSAALWVTDSGNWFAVGLAREAVNCNCYQYYNYYEYYSSYCWDGVSYTGGNCNQYSPSGYCIYYTGGNCNGTYNTTSCAQFNTTSCKSWTGGNCKGYNATSCGSYYYYYSNVNKKGVTNCSGYVGGNCSGYNATSCSANNTATCKNYNFSNCNGNINALDCALWSGGYYCSGNINSTNPAYYTCLVSGQSGPYTACSTCYPQYIRVLQSIGNSVSTLAQWTVSSVVNSFRVKTNNNEIQVDAFSGSDFTSQIDGTLTYTPTSVNVETNFGIMISPSSYDQRTTIDDVEIKRNPS